LIARRAETTDIPAMMLLEQRSPTAAHWSKEQYEVFFLNTSSQLSESVAWVAENVAENVAKDAAEDVVENELEEFQLLGFLAARRLDTEWELENIVVAEHVRRRGTGEALLDKLIAHARKAGGTAVFLEVRESNQNARALYRKTGFRERGFRKNYYSNPVEDAVLLNLVLP
jgi:ribosomal-protein-alanine N-acetyltransferase